MTSSRHWSTTGRLLSSEGVRQILWSFCWDPPVVSCCFCQDYKACILEESATVLTKFQNLWCRHVLNSRYGAGIRWSMSPPARATCTQPRRSYLLVDFGYPAANQMSTLARAAHDWQTKWLRKQTCSRFRNCLEFNSCFFPRRLDKEQLAQKWRNYKVKIVKYQTYLSSFRKMSKLYIRNTLICYVLDFKYYLFKQMNVSDIRNPPLELKSKHVHHTNHMMCLKHWRTGHALYWFQWYLNR